MINCQICNSEMKMIPAGVSKSTGKPYSTFYACPNKCRQGATAPQAPQAKKDPDWESISRGKVRHGIVCAMLQNGKTYEDIVPQLLRFEELIMRGSKPQPQAHDDLPTISIDEIPF